ncbi:protein of unknown function [Candidatus Filomicrobium marinum]|uniref:Uncharacterized protein n=1 Tax=Candidatus Filomicrobium marinum TaxID=1608628 RepID=A0A0D6JA76_9HYPH|nr:protein of unknown function [Candidatus Filomicrobium marinum]CPR14762.1 protein of unknown function [Candidatus Filomicrobium marinum]
MATRAKRGPLVNPIEPQKYTALRADAKAPQGANCPFLRFQGSSGAKPRLVWPPGIALGHTLVTTSEQRFINAIGCVVHYKSARVQLLIDPDLSD